MSGVRFAQRIGHRLAILIALITLSGCSTQPVPQSPASSAVTSAPATSVEPSAAEPAAGQEVHFVTSDGVALEGRLFGAGRDGVVLAHMRPASMETWFPFAMVLAAEGFRALAFNFRGYGESGGERFAVDVDVMAAIDAMQVGGSRVLVIGASIGGTGAIAAAAERDVAGVVTLSAPAAFEGADALAAMPSVGAPVLLMAAEGDQPYASDAERLRAANPDDAEVILLAGSRHGTDLFQEHGQALTDTILGFLRDPSS